MSTNRLFLVPAAVLIAAVALIALVGGLSGEPANAAPLIVPPAAPTPITVSQADSAINATFWRGQTLTRSGASNIYELPAADRLDLQWVVDVGEVNTTTIKLQFSNDGANWVDGLDVEKDIAADKNSLQQFNLFGRYARLYATLTNTEPITITAIGVAK